ncbi:MAG: accessory factor UbiK family protein [Acidiferrobacteraceae bacterium]
MKTDNRFVEQATHLIREVLPGLGRDTEQVLRARLEALFARLDLVTREEFDVQKAVLARTRAELERIEREVARLEAGRKA